VGLPDMTIDVLRHAARPVEDARRADHSFDIAGTTISVERQLGVGSGNAGSTGNTGNTSNTGSSGNSGARA
jgi:hypothetical protein